MSLTADLYDRVVDELLAPPEAKLLRNMAKRSRSPIKVLLGKAVTIGLVSALDSEERLCAHRARLTSGDCSSAPARRRQTR